MNESKLLGDNIKFISANTDKSLDWDKTDSKNLYLRYLLVCLASLTPSGLPSVLLNLKAGCIVMLLKNLCSSDGLCNDTRLVVTQ